MLIKRIKSVDKAGVFRRFSAQGGDTDFRRYTLVYGFNGSGKTTLSRIFSSLERGQKSPRLPYDACFEVELADDMIVGLDRNLTVLKGKVSVFNTDFVEENFQWNDGSARPIFYIGKEQVQLGKQLQIAEGELEEKRRVEHDVVEALARQLSATAHFKREAARSIGDQLSIRAYDARTLDSDYSTAKLDHDGIVDDAKRDALRGILLQSEPLSKIRLLAKDNFGVTYLEELADRAVRCLADTAGTLAVAELAQHQSMAGWARTGLEYHTKYDLETCLFCGNPIGTERLEALRATIDNKLSVVLRATEELITDFQDIKTPMVTGSLGLPSVNDVIQDRRLNFQKAASLFRLQLGKVISFLDMALDLLKTKLDEPNTIIRPTEANLKQYARQLSSHLEFAIDEVNDCIIAHNKANDAFSETQANAKRELRAHFLSVYRSSYEAHQTQLATAKLASEKATEDVKGLVSAVEDMRGRLQSHGPAATAINELIKSYLQHGELEIVAIADGFEIRRHGDTIARHLSEGEKTAITFCYFISSLEAEGRRLRDLIVVLDDPISSLDTKSLNYAFSFIKSHVAKCQQLIVLTHNINFMNACRSWLKPKAREVAASDGQVRIPTASLLFLDSRCNDEGRSSTIVRLPTLIRDYDSEYHYLFSLVKTFSETRSGVSDYLFLMPNAMRKVTEIFLAFKRPGADGLGSKVEAIASGNYGIDGARLRALDRLVQLESHADSLDDLIGFSSMTLEEAFECALALMEVIEKLDKEHYTLLCGQCH